AAARLPKALDPDNRGAGTNRKLLGRLAPRSSTFDLRNHSFPHLPRIGLRHRPASQKRINADRLSHLWPHENPPDSIGAEHALASILAQIEDAAAALEKCEKNPNNCPKPAAGPGPGGGAVIPGGGGAVTPGGKKLPAIPACKDQNFLDELENMLQQVNKDLGIGGHGLEGQLNDMEKNDPQYANLKKKVDELKAERAAIEAHKAAAERKWKENKEKCDPPKKSSMIFPGTPLRPTNQTYAVTFAGDSTAVCTFDDGTSVPAPIAFADDAGNPLDPDKLPPNTDIIRPKTPETPPTPTADLPPKTSETPPTQTAETPPETPPTTRPTETPPKTSETPPTQTTEAPPPKTPEIPPTQTTDTPPPSIPDTVFVKAK